jgi:hypothetical protein
VTTLRDHDRLLIAGLEDQSDWDAAIERECDELQSMQLRDLFAELDKAEWERCTKTIADRVEANPDTLTEDEQKWLKRYIVETFGTDVAERRIDAR